MELAPGWRRAFRDWLGVLASVVSPHLITQILWCFRLACGASLLRGSDNENPLCPSPPIPPVCPYQSDLINSSFLAIPTSTASQHRHSKRLTTVAQPWSDSNHAERIRCSRCVILQSPPLFHVRTSLTWPSGFSLLHLLSRSTRNRHYRLGAVVVSEADAWTRS